MVLLNHALSPDPASLEVCLLVEMFGGLEALILVFVGLSFAHVVLLSEYFLILFLKGLVLVD